MKEFRVNSGGPTGRFQWLPVVVLLASQFLACYASADLGILNLTGNGKYKVRDSPMHKVAFTQRGYIQFLRWELPVPEIKEFTFCLWVQSVNLTYAHSIFSYSKDERDRLIRSWITPNGRSVHLEIGGEEVLAKPINIREHRWYHICQSWENHSGRYALWIDGRVRVQGQAEKTINHVIPSGGDIVVGQEYTDFDKGLEEGIEGSVFGFNLLLASSFSPLARIPGEATYDSIPQSSVSSYMATFPFVARIPMKIMQPDIDHRHGMPVTFFPVTRAYRSIEGNKDMPRLPMMPRGTIDLRADGKFFGSQKPIMDPLGLQLVKLTYVRCETGRGSPFIGGPLMLISWSRTPVRVFGGATLKNAKRECGNF